MEVDMIQNVYCRYIMIYHDISSIYPYNIIIYIYQPIIYQYKDVPYIFQRGYVIYIGRIPQSGHNDSSIRSTKHMNSQKQIHSFVQAFSHVFSPLFQVQIVS